MEGRFILSSLVVAQTHSRKLEKGYLKLLHCPPVKKCIFFLLREYERALW